VVVKSNGQLGIVASSARYKRDIKPLAGAAGSVAEKLAQLRPVSFRYKTEPEATHYGLIAEEVDRVMPELVVRDGDNRPDSVQYQELVPLLLQQWKAQQAEIARQRAEIERQQDLLERQQAENARQQSRLERQEAALAELRRTLAMRFAALDGTH
jgi:trimeric autotransporter adhesin